MNDRERDVLIEASVSAHRGRDADGLPLSPPEWWDLSPDQLDDLYRRQVEARAIERLVDAQGQSSTVKAVLARLFR